MAAINYNLNIEKGSDFNITFIYNDSNNNPIDLSNKCVVWSIIGSDSSLRTYSSQALSDYNQNGWSITANNLGVISLRLSAEETNKFIFESAVYDLDIKELNTIKLNNTRIAEGSVSIISRNSSINLLCPTNLDSLSITNIVSPNPTNTGTPAISPTPLPEIDFCLPYDCGPLDLFSTVYGASGLSISDTSSVSGSVVVTNTGIISNVELAINKLNHTNPTDLVLLLAPPSGDKILLSANHKIPNYNNNFSFMFSNKADNTKYLHNISNGQICNIYDKTSYINYNNETLYSSFDHLFGHSITGVWTLMVRDTDPLGSGSFDSWKLIITYNNPIEEN